FVGVNAATGNDLGVLDTAPGGVVSPLLQTPFREGAPVFSPDGRFFAYVSDSSGRNEIYVRPFPGPGQEGPVSSGGGTEPPWPRQSHEIFFRQGDAVFAVDVMTSPALKLGQPRRLFERAYKRSNAVWPNYDVTPDGRRLLMIKSDRPALPLQFNVI